MHTTTYTHGLCGLTRKKKKKKKKKLTPTCFPKIDRPIDTCMRLLHILKARYFRTDTRIPVMNLIWEGTNSMM